MFEKRGQDHMERVCCKIVEGIANGLLRVSLCDRNPDVVRALVNDFHDVGGVEVLEGDLLGLDGDAVVSPANSFGYTIFRKFC